MALRTFSLALTDNFEKIKVQVAVITITIIPLTKEIPIKLYINQSPIITSNGVKIKEANWNPI